MSLISDIHNDLENSAIQLIAEYRARLFADAVRLCDNQATADDLVSRTFLKVINNIDQHRPDADFYAWMKTIMVNLHRDDLDRPVTRRTTPVPSEALELYAGADNSTDEQILRNSDHDALREAINRLDPEYRQMMAMYYYNELSLKEIASFFRTSTSSVSRKLEIARKILAAKLGTQLGKKPVALLLAALLGVGTLFGAWVSPLGDWVAEKVFGNAPAAETVQDEEPAPDIDLPSDIEGPDDNELQDNGVEPAGEERVASTPARQADANVISETQKQKGEGNMNISARIKKTVAAASVAAMGLTAAATTYHVAPNGSDSTGDGSAGAPFASIVRALGAANDGDVIQLSDGTYLETNISITKAVTVRGNAADRSAVTVDAKKAGRVFTVGHADAVIADLTVMNGLVEEGGATSVTLNGITAVNVSGANLILTQGTATNCVFKDGGAACAATAGNVFIMSGLIVGCRIDGGYSLGYGGNLYMYGGRVSRCEIVNGVVCPNGDASSGCGSAAIHGWPDFSNAVVDNCLIMSNKCLSTGTNLGGTAGVCEVGSTGNHIMIYINCTIADNLGSSAGWRPCVRINWVNNRPAPQMYNCIIFNNGGTTDTEFLGGPKAQCCHNCATTVEMSGIDNNTLIPKDRARVFQSAVDFRPRATSDLLGAGTTTVNGGIPSTSFYACIGEIDMAGSPRVIKDGHVTLGCYEAVDSVTPSAFDAVVGEAVAFTVGLIDGTAGRRYRWTFGDGSAPVETDTPAASHVYSTFGVYVASVCHSADGGTTWSEDLTCAIRAAAHPGWITVSKTGDDERGDGTEWNPFATIQRGLACAVAGASRKTVFVRAGTYAEHGLDVTAGITVRGEGRDKTIVDGESLDRVFFVDHEAAVLADMTICNGKVTEGRSVYSKSVAGANVCLVYGTVTNCVLRDGYASYSGAAGGNAYVYNGLIVDCRLDGGKCDGFGGGVNMSGGRLLRCEIVNGVLAPGGGSVANVSGAAIHTYPDIADAIIDNCLIMSNKCLSSGLNSGYAGICDIGSSDRHTTFFVNCTIADNLGSTAGWEACVRIPPNSGRPEQKVINCVLFNNGGTAETEWYGSKSAVSRFSYCASTIQITDGANCCVVPTTARKVFAYGGERPFEPAVRSALRKAGSVPLYEQYSVSANDLYGRKRVVCDTIDIGCVERLSSGMVMLFY